jgi:protein-S-isoprenylcysteine O-methyltransferase Ste14
MPEHREDPTAPHGDRREAGAAPDTAGVIAPPPVIYGAGLAVGLGVDWLLGLPALPGLGDSTGFYLGAVLGVTGLLLVLAAAGRFVKAGTSLPPHRPSSALVTDGLYRYSRNPIYLGVTLGYLGFVALLASLGALLVLPAVILIMEVGVIRREERYLERKFGTAYRDYRARVRRWL